MKFDSQAVSPVTRTKAQAKNNYDRMSPFYDYFAGNFERTYGSLALERLKIVPGEIALEVGFGTGHHLEKIARAVGETGRVYGIDISSGMLAVSRRRLEKAGLTERVELTCDDALCLPYPDHIFNVAFMSFVLELFDTPEIPLLLAEVKRVLKPAGRLGIVSMSKEDNPSLLLRLYEWLHQKMPQSIDCRPIHVGASIKAAGYSICSLEQMSLAGLPVAIAVGVKPASFA